MNEIELAHVNDVDRCLKIINSGKKFQNDQGFVEWTDDSKHCFGIGGKIDICLPNLWS